MRILRNLEIPTEVDDRERLHRPRTTAVPYRRFSSQLRPPSIQDRRRSARERPKPVPGRLFSSCVGQKPMDDPKIPGPRQKFAALHSEISAAERKIAALHVQISAARRKIAVPHVWKRLAAQSTAAPDRFFRGRPREQAVGHSRRIGPTPVRYGCSFLLQEATNPMSNAPGQADRRSQALPVSLHLWESPIPHASAGLLNFPSKQRRQQRETQGLSRRTGMRNLFSGRYRRASSILKRGREGLGRPRHAEIHLEQISVSSLLDVELVGVEPAEAGAEFHVRNPVGDVGVEDQVGG